VFNSYTKLIPMNTLIKIACTLFVLTCLSSCASYQEELWLNANGSGRYVITADNSASLGLIEALSQMSLDEESGESGATDFWESVGGEEVNKSINLRDSLPAEFLDRLSRPELLDQIDFNMLLSKEKELFKTVLSIEFKSLSELDILLDLTSEINNQMKSSEDGTDFIEGLEFFASRPGGHGFKLEEGRLIRNATQEDEAMLDNFLSDSETLESLEMMMEQSTMTTIIHLPGDVYQINNQSKLGTVDGKTVTFSYQLLDLVKKEVDTAFEILFKK